MECPECQVENREEAKFCKKCGAKLILLCPSCGQNYECDSSFCDECGQTLCTPSHSKSLEQTNIQQEDIDFNFKEKDRVCTSIEGERKYAAILFSDLSGFTSMSEKLDPEELKEIMSRIFGEIAQVVANYEGFIEKFIGDAVMAIFGVPKVHEDDPIRAIKAAKEIHELIEKVSPQIEKRIGQSISMHSGINTGLVVTGALNMEEGIHGVAGEAVNIASRLCDLASKGEILVGLDTYKQGESHFTFENLESTKVKGKKDPIQVYKVLSAKEKPETVRRFKGLRANLTGRKAELSELVDAVENLKRGEGRIFSICATAGTGKSRLVEEFKNSIDLKKIQWIEGHAYAYSQNISYFPFIDLLNRLFQIDDDDSPENRKIKIESGIENLLGRNDFFPFIGSLYSLNYDEVETVSPEFRKSRLQEAAKAIISALARKGPAIFFLEDLHWADPSFVELLHYTLIHTREPAIVLCVYRPIFNLYTSHQLSGIKKIYQEIRLKDLSPSEAQDMLESLLKTETIPSDLKRFVQQKAEGNPFYLEELINSLIESKTLTKKNNAWEITKPITESDISPTIHGLVAGRLDRLEEEIKRILQEASVIGRAFLYDILKRITEVTERIDRDLSTLERLDLIRTKSLQPDLEYMFKHPLTQEVVYNSLLKKDRQAIHEQVAKVMEQNFQDRLPEFYETLAFHYREGKSLDKAVNYLIKSGEKSVERFTVHEAHQYYKEAFEILSNITDRSDKEKETLIDLFDKWSLVFYYRGDFAGQIKLLEAHEDIAATISDRSKQGMFFAWLGWAYFFRGKVEKSYQYLIKALNIGEDIEDQRTIGYACTWLSFTCSALGHMDEGIAFGERAQRISGMFKRDHYMYFKSLSGIAFAYVWKGDVQKVFNTANSIVDYGQSHSNPRAKMMGYWMMQFGCLIEGDYDGVVKWMRAAVELLVDPLYENIGSLYLGIGLMLAGQTKEAEERLNEFVSWSQEKGNEVMEVQAQWFLGMASISNGKMSQGLRLMEHSQHRTLEYKTPVLYSYGEILLGNLYLQIVDKSVSMSFSTAARNIGFLAKNVPFASKKAEEHFNKALETAQEIGAKAFLGHASLGIGRLYKVKRKRDQASNYIRKAVKMFEKCQADASLKLARIELEYSE